MFFDLFVEYPQQPSFENQKQNKTCISLFYNLRLYQFIQFLESDIRQSLFSHRTESFFFFFFFLFKVDFRILNNSV